MAKSIKLTALTNIFKAGTMKDNGYEFKTVYHSLTKEETELLVLEWINNRLEDNTQETFSFESGLELLIGKKKG